MKNCWFFCVVLLSPSSRAEWVEIGFFIILCAQFDRLRPRGRSGLKLDMDALLLSCPLSPSSRAEWVEILDILKLNNLY